MMAHKQTSLLIDRQNATIMLHDLVAPEQGSYDIDITAAAHCDVIINETIDRASNNAHHTLELRAHEKSTITYICRIKNSSKTFCLHKHIKARMLGNNAEITIFVYSHGSAHQNIRLTIEQEHATDNSFSNVMVKTLLDDHAKMSCAGIIKVAPQTKGNRATLTIKTMMLSDTAQASANPQLEILADDVSCKHGATFETIDAESLFYLQSRGITCHCAKNMLLKAFLNE